MSLNELASALNELADALLTKASGEYTYDIVNEKRFIPDADACEVCEDAADEGWVEDDFIYDGVLGDEDGPPLHPHCKCSLEYRERRVRVYE